MDSRGRRQQQPPRTKVLIIGHSFISRLKTQLRIKDYFDYDFHLMQCNVRCFGKGGGRIDTLHEDPELWACLNSFRPSIAIIQVGGNDICDKSLKPETIACDMVDLTGSLLELNYVQVAVVCELFTRRNPRGITPEVYERKRRVINTMMPNLLQDMDPHSALFWKHWRLMNSPLRIFHDDGTHLNYLGYKKYYRNIRLAILHALDCF